MARSYQNSLLDIWDLDDASCTRELQLLLDSSLKTSGSDLEGRPHMVPDSSNNSLRLKRNAEEDQELTGSFSAGVSFNPVFPPLTLQHNQSICKEVRKPEHIQCQQCFSENERESHWCTNCGTVLVHRDDTSQSPNTNPVSSWDTTTNSIVASLSKLEPNDFPQSSADLSQLSRSDRDSQDPKPLTNILSSRKNGLCASNGYGFVSTQHKQRVSDKVSLQATRAQDLRSSTIPRVPVTRRWNTSSSMYAWRKPSTLHRDDDLPKYESDMQVDYGSKISIPFLDLSSVSQFDSSSYTLREKMITNKEYKLPKSRTSPMESLPDELLLHMMSFLAEKDLICCMHVCSRLYYIATDKTLWKDVTLRKKTLDQRDLVCLAQRCPCLEKLTFEKCSLKAGVLAVDFNMFFSQVPHLKTLKSVMNDFGPTTGDRLLFSTATHCPQLCIVDFDWTRLTEKVLQKSIKLISRLESLTIDQHGDISQETLNLLFVRHREWLKSLSIGMGTTVEKVLASLSDVQPLPNLLTFVATFDTVDFNVIEKLQKVFPSLKHLTVHYHQLASFPEEISAQLTSIPLYSLYFELYSGLSPACCKHIAQIITLRELSLDCVDDDGMEILCSGQLSLEVLDLSNSFITMLSLVRIGESAFRLVLKSLKLNGCIGIKRKDEVFFLIGQCSKLQVIELNEVPCAAQLSRDLNQMSYSVKVISKGIKQ